MGTIVAKKLIDAVAKTLQDETNVRWLRPELLAYLNDAQREIVLAKPDSFVINMVFQLLPGAKQTIPANGILFMRMNVNLGVSGTVPGRAPRMIPIRVLDEQIPTWRAFTPDPVVLHYTFDEKDPKRFYNYPPQPTVNPNQVEIVYSASPPDVATEDDPMTLDDVWKTAIIHYMEYRSYSKDADYARQDGPAATAYQSFATLIGIKGKVDDQAKASK